MSKHPVVAVVIGHHPIAQGSYLTYAGHKIGEYDFWRPHALSLAAHLKQREFHPVVIERPEPSPNMKLIRKINNSGAVCAIELHFNGFSDGAVSGSEVLYLDGSREDQALATALQQANVSALGLRDRGIKPSTLPFIRGTVMPSCIVEPAFGSNLRDTALVVRNVGLLMRKYAAAVEEWFYD
jgi:N-acetylmuramoyl-L-alanine amidase